VTDKPRIGYAALDQKAHLHAPARYLPIIIVPGIAASRLTDPVTNKLAWNPLGAPLGKSPGAFAADMDRLSQVSSELVPDETHTFEEDSASHIATVRIKHYYNVLHDVYGTMATRFATMNLEVPDLPVAPKVYGCRSSATAQTPRNIAVLTA
jgi:hypothetical protein